MSQLWTTLYAKVCKRETICLTESLAKVELWNKTIIPKYAQQEIHNKIAEKLKNQGVAMTWLKSRPQSNCGTLQKWMSSNPNELKQSCKKEWEFLQSDTRLIKFHSKWLHQPITAKGGSINYLIIGCTPILTRLHRVQWKVYYISLEFFFSYYTLHNWSFFFKNPSNYTVKIYLNIGGFVLLSHMKTLSCISVSKLVLCSLQGFWVQDLY